MIGFSLKKNAESDYLRRRPFPLHAMTQNLKVNRHILTRRRDSKLFSPVKVIINFKECLKFSKEIEFEEIQLDTRPSQSPNDLIRDMMSFLYLKFDRRLLLNTSSNKVFLLRQGEKHSFFAGEEPLFNYEPYVLAGQLRNDLKLTLVEMSREGTTGEVLSCVEYQQNFPRVSPDNVENLVLWYFPAKVEAPREEVIGEGFEVMTKRVEGAIKLKETRNMYKAMVYFHPFEVGDVATSDEVRMPVRIRIYKLENIQAMFKKIDFTQDTYEKKRFALLSEIKNKLILDDRPITDEPNFNPLHSNSQDFLKTLFKKFDAPRSDRSLPLLFFINGRLFHGTKLLDSSDTILVPMKNNFEFKNESLMFRNYTIDRLPLEARVSIEVSVLYGNSNLKKLGTVNFTMFDSQGYLRTGTRRMALWKYVGDSELPGFVIEEHHYSEPNRNAFLTLDLGGSL